jgi:hypothetical protein
MRGEHIALEGAIGVVPGLRHVRRAGEVIHGAWVNGLERRGYRDWVK